MPAMSDCSWPVVPWILRILTRFAGNGHPNLGETEEALSGCQVRARESARESALDCSLPSTRSVDPI